MNWFIIQINCILAAASTVLLVLLMFESRHPQSPHLSQILAWQLSPHSQFLLKVSRCQSCVRLSMWDCESFLKTVCHRTDQPERQQWSTVVLMVWCGLVSPLLTLHLWKLWWASWHSVSQSESVIYLSLIDSFSATCWVFVQFGNKFRRHSSNNLKSPQEQAGKLCSQKE